MQRRLEVRDQQLCEERVAGNADLRVIHIPQAGSTTRLYAE